MRFVQWLLWVHVSSHAYGHSQFTLEEKGERHRTHTEIPTVTWHTQPPLTLGRCSSVRLKAGGAVLPCPTLSWASKASERQGNISKLNEVCQEDGKFLWQSGERESENDRGSRKKRAKRERVARYGRGLFHWGMLGCLATSEQSFLKFNSGLFCALSLSVELVVLSTFFRRVKSDGQQWAE